MRIGIISDAHCQFPGPELLPKDIDLLIIAGDLTRNGIESQLLNFVDKLARYHVPDQIILIAGNHDIALESDPDFKIQFINYLQRKMPNRAKYLEHESFAWEGLKFFGTPYVPKYCNLAFNRENIVRQRLWKEIPGDVDVLITHTPMRGMLDGVHRDYQTAQGTSIEACGCPYLTQRIGELGNLKLHAFGHIHEHGGELVKLREILFANGALLNPNKGGLALPIVTVEI